MSNGGGAAAPVEKSVVNISPASMVDSVSEWPLGRVIEHLRKKEQDDNAPLEESRRISYRTNIRILASAVGDAAKRYGVSQSKMQRWLSYHAVAMLKDDVMLSSLADKYAELTRIGLAEADSDILDILNAIVPYSPKNIDDRSGVIDLYSAWVRTDFQEMATVCGVRAYRVVQVYVMRSIMTGDHESMADLMHEFTIESERWDKWMQMRLGAITGMLEKNPFGEEKKEKK